MAAAADCRAGNRQDQSQGTESENMMAACVQHVSVPERDLSLLGQHSAGGDRPDGFQTVAAKDIKRVVQHGGEVGISDDEFDLVADPEVVRPGSEINPAMLGAQSDHLRRPEILHDGMHMSPLTALRPASTIARSILVRLTTVVSTVSAGSRPVTPYWSRVLRVAEDAAAALQLGDGGVVGGELVGAGARGAHDVAADALFRQDPSRQYSSTPIASLILPRFSCGSATWCRCPS